MAIFAQQTTYLGALRILSAILREVQYDARTAVELLRKALHLELGRAVAAPMHARLLGAVRLREYLYPIGHHERRVEAQAEVTDDGLILILLHKLLGTREGYLVDVAIYLLGRHAYTAVGDCQGLGSLIDSYAYCQVAKLAIELTLRREGFELLRSIHSVGYQLA